LIEVNTSFVESYLNPKNILCQYVFGGVLISLKHWSCQNDTKKDFARRSFFAFGEEGGKKTFYNYAM
jgi:hypothetical protein